MRELDVAANSKEGRSRHWGKSLGATGEKQMFAVKGGRQATPFSSSPASNGLGLIIEDPVRGTLSTGYVQGVPYEHV